MLLKLDKAQYSEIEKYTRSIGFPLIQAVVQQKQQGEIYASLNQISITFFIIHKSGFSYYFHSGEERIDITHFINTSRELPSYFHLYDPPAFLLKENLFIENYNFKIRKRIQLKISADKIRKENNKLPSNVEVKKIDASNWDKLKAIGFSADKFYESPDDFLQNGLGVCIFDQNNQVLAMCYSACIVNDVTEIDILTSPQCRNQGYGKLITTAFVKLALEKGIESNWDCFEENQASLKTALKAGFTVTKEYNFLSLYKR